MFLVFFLLKAKNMGFRKVKIVFEGDHAIWCRTPFIFLIFKGLIFRLNIRLNQHKDGST